MSNAEIREYLLNLTCKKCPLENCCKQSTKDINPCTKIAEHINN